MAAYIQKHPLEIPPPSEKDWLKDDEEDFFLQDPDQERDALPQPFRMINKLVMLVFENAMEITERREMLQEAQKLKVTGRANCLTASGKYIFVGLSVGLAAFEASDCKEVCAWDVVKAEVCAIHASDLGNEHHVLLAVDEMGLVWLFCFYKESFLLTKILNEVEDISKRSTCVEVVLSSGGDYTGVLLQDSTKAWLEIYRLPKDSWLKEMEKSPGTAAGVACREKRSSWTSVEFPVSANKADAKLSLPVLLLKVKPPKPITESWIHRKMLTMGREQTLCWDTVRENAIESFKSPLDALKKVDDGSMLGLGYNHLIKDSQWEQQEAIFRSTYWEYLEAEGERESKEETPSLLLSFVIPFSVLDIPVGISVHWDGSHSLCFYFLNCPLKEKVDSDPKPDVLWPCAAPIACSAVSSCSRYLALACEDATITVWDKHLGDKQQQADALAQSRDSHSTIFIFDFTSYPLKEAFPKELDLPLKSLQNLPWLERCNIFLRDRQQSLMGLQDQLPEYWNQLQAQAAAMDKERQKVKEQKKL